MDATQDETALGPILKAVSRSFYLSMVFLPSEMRPAVSVGYLLARASDSVADNSLAPDETRLHILRGMKSLIMDTQLKMSEQVALLDTITGPMADTQENPHEAKLLSHYHDCLRILRELPAQQQELVIRVLECIHDGQIWDIEYFQQQSRVQSEEATLLYCYQVAGCVGEFWTRIGQATLPHYSNYPQREELIEAGIRYGQGLQLVNILRDEQEDAQRGRAYLCGDRSLWMRRARHYLSDGLAYSKRLSSLRLRFTAMLPALLGLKTLEKLESTPATQVKKVKISRTSVYLSMLKALVLSLCV